LFTNIVYRNSTAGALRVAITSIAIAIFASK